jgi:hypothetical protein
MFGSGGGVQTSPPQYNYEEVTTPGGSKAKIPVPVAQPGGAPIQTEPAKGATSSEAGKVQLAQSGIEAYRQVKDLIFDPNTGKSNWGNLAASVGPGMPWTQGKQIKGLIMRSTDAIVRAATGAGLNSQELSAYAEMYAPSMFDNEQTVKSKMAGLENFLNGYLEKMDPTGSQRARVGQAPAATPTPTAPAAGSAKTADDYLKKKGLK